MQRLGSIYNHLHPDVFGQEEELETSSEGSLNPAFAALLAEEFEDAPNGAIVTSDSLDASNTAEETSYKKELLIAQKLHHPNIVSYAIATRNKVVLELADKGSLKDAAVEASAKEFKHYMQNAASGLAYLHEEGFLHRDVKPENILVFEDVEKLADLESVHSLDVFKQGCYGTLYYLPKEVMKCEVVSNDPKQLKSIDVYAYGMSIFMLLKQEQYTSPFLSDINDNTKLGKYTNELSFVMAAAEHPELTKVHLDPLLDAKKVARLDEAGELRALMTACLRGNPNARPSFDDIVHRLEASD